MNAKLSEINNNKPIATIIIPAYKRTKFIAQAISSVLEQTRADFDLIVTDDSNSPEIHKICALFSDDRLIYKANIERLGVLKNCENALSMVRGEYVLFLNDDDFLDSDFLAIMVEIMEHNSHLAFAFCDHWIVDENGIRDQFRSDKHAVYCRRDTLPEGELKNPVDALFDGSIIVGNASLFRKSLINSSMAYNEVGVCADLWTACVYVQAKLPIYYVNKRLLSYRVHKDSETNRGNSALPDSERFIYNFILQEGWFQEKKDLIYKRLGDATFRSAKSRLINGQRDEARKIFRTGLWNYKSCRWILGYLLSFLPTGMTSALLNFVQKKDFYSNVRVP
ncbi:hypothetical protein B1757_04170 [Acidithiobacillus marinus]|uniref:Glycosyltransferase 2-like domain-containing protein n=1 Tax=Acidithiobacillus marinus TaxID=187490 RepID=A0A2I1DNI3_9PROT|nr:glycosyltransferase [Acidithiobacillus marinus]PKY11421.1 hypothetical protein B1757_04170 [Acidithiobacillus marinus]